MSGILASTRRLAGPTLLIAAIGAAACSDLAPWTAFVTSPWESDKPRTTVIGPYQSLEICRSAALAELDKRGWKQAGSYNCGFRCELHRDTHICKGMQK